MREIRPYGSEGGVPRKRGIPTPIRKILSRVWTTFSGGRAAPTAVRA
jgi:hypothetical protein